MLRKGPAESAVASFARYSEATASLLWEWSAWAHCSPVPVFELGFRLGEGIEVADDLVSFEQGLTQEFVGLVAMGGGARSGSAVYGERWFEAIAGHSSTRKTQRCHIRHGEPRFPRTGRQELGHIGRRGDGMRVGRTVLF